MFGEYLETRLFNKYVLIFFNKKVLVSGKETNKLGVVLFLSATNVQYAYCDRILNNTQTWIFVFFVTFQVQR